MPPISLSATQKFTKVSELLNFLYPTTIMLTFEKFHQSNLPDASKFRTSKISWGTDLCTCICVRVCVRERVCVFLSLSLSFFCPLSLSLKMLCASEISWGTHLCTCTCVRVCERESMCVSFSLSLFLLLSLSLSKNALRLKNLAGY